MKKIRLMWLTLGQIFGYALCLVFGLGLIGYYIEPDVKFFQFSRENIAFIFIGSLTFTCSNQGKELLKLKAGAK